MDRKRYFSRKDKDFKNGFFHLVISYCKCDHAVKVLLVIKADCSSVSAE